MNEPSEMPTPRTDAATKFSVQIYPHENGYIETVEANFARQLERDLSTLRKAAEAAKRAIEGAMNGKSYWFHNCEAALASLRSELAKTTPATPETPVPRPG